MKIIGHRGARGLAAENTLAAIKRGLAEGVDVIEFDVHRTKDDQLVLLHDDTFLRTCGLNKAAKNLTLAQIQQSVKTNEGEPIPTLEEALLAIKNTNVFIEGKGKHWAQPLARVLRNHPKAAQCTIISFDHQELAAFGKLTTGFKLYGLEQTHPFAAIRSAKNHGFAGIDLRYSILYPLVYYQARRAGLDIAVYTVNRPFIARLIQLLYPHVAITTDYPDVMQRFRR